MAKCLVTGGAGFIGSNLVRGLLSQDHEVIVWDDFSIGRRTNLLEIEGSVQIIERDIRDGERLKSALQGVKYLFHEAALPSVARSVDDPWSSNDVNINGTLTVLLAARDAGVSRVIYAASSAAYGNTDVLPRVETLKADPLSPYAVNKYVGELYCSVFSRVYGLESVSLRYSNVFGPRQNRRSQYASAIPRFITAFLAGEAPTIYGDGEQTRDFIYVENVVAANLAAATAPAAGVTGQVFNIGGGDRISVNTLVREIQTLTGSTLEPVYAAPRPGDVRDSQADITRAQEKLAYKPVMPFQQGLQATVEWFRQHDIE